MAPHKILKYKTFHTSKQFIDQQNTLTVLRDTL